MNTGTIIRTILAVATVINSGAIAAGIAEFENPTVNMIYKVLSFCATAVILFINTWYNNDFTPVAAEYTGAMRQEKARQKGEEIGVDIEGLEYIEDGDEDE